MPREFWTSFLSLGTKELKNIAIIPARGGSKRVKGKNLKKLGNKPLIQYTIEFAIASKIDNIFVSTDCDEIRDFSSRFGISLVKRPSHLATDSSTTFDVVKHLIDYTKIKVDNIFLLQPTCPFRPRNLIKKALDLFSETNCDSVTSYRKVDFFHPNRIKVIDNYNVRDYCEKEIENVSISELPPAYQRDGYLYSFTLNTLIKKRSFFGDNQKGIIINDGNIVNIDTHIDWLVAESYLNEKL